MKKLMITGVSGFLGSRLSDYYRDTYEVIPVTRQMMDFQDEKKTVNVVKTYCPDIVIHCGAVSDTGACDRDPVSSYAVNVAGTKAVALACAECGAKLIFCSSDQIYNGTTGLEPHKESDTVSPRFTYAGQKLEAERIAEDILPDTVCLRLSWMYDAVTVREGEHKDLLRLLAEGIREKRVMSYPIWDYRGITYVMDAVRLMELAFELPGGIYNFGSPNFRSTYDTVKALFDREQLDCSLLVPDGERFAQSPRNLCMDQEKARSFGICFPSTEEGLFTAFKKLGL